MRISPPESGPAGSAAPGDDRGTPAASRPLRILHVVTRLGVGGTEYVLSRLFTGLGGETFDQRICSMRGFDPAFTRSPHFDGRLHSAGGPDARFQLALLRLARILRECRADIVHSRNWGAIEAIPAARLAGVPVAIHSEHGYEVGMLDGLPLRQRVFRRMVYPMADAVFAVTEELRDYHARQAWTAPERMRVLYNGVDTERFAPRPEAGREARRVLGLPPGAFVVGHVGRMVPIKDHGTLLRAAEQLVRKDVDARVLLVGAGPELERVRRDVEASGELRGRVVLPGASDRIADLLAAMDVFVLPSLREGMSNTTLEAMASGLPVIATRVGGNPEVVDDGVSGWLFAPGDAGALAAFLLRLSSDAGLRRAAGEAGRRRAVERFGLERMLRDYRSLYLELAARRGIPSPSGPAARRRPS
jgi:sugar transferase (PEP-CTERM/EpsH1 system associated)